MDKETKTEADDLYLKIMDLCADYDWPVAMAALQTACNEVLDSMSTGNIGEAYLVFIQSILEYRE